MPLRPQNWRPLITELAKEPHDTSWGFLFSGRYKKIPERLNGEGSG